MSDDTVKRFDNHSRQEIIGLVEAREAQLAKCRRFSRHFHGELERVEMKAKTLRRDIDCVPVAMIPASELIERLDEIIALCVATVDWVPEQGE